MINPWFTHTMNLPPLELEQGPEAVKTFGKPLKNVPSCVCGLMFTHLAIDRYR